MSHHSLAILLGLVLTALLAAPRPARAQTSALLAGAAQTDALTLTIEDTVSRARAQAPRIAEARAREAAAAAVEAGRVAQGGPILTASSGYLRTNHVPEFGVPQVDGSFRVIFPDLPNNYRARGELTVPVFTGGRIDALVSAAKADGRAAGADRLVVEADVTLDVTRAYWTLVFARASVGVLTEALSRADAAVRDVGARVDTGLLPPNDLLSARAQRARQQVRLIQAQQDASIAEADLGRLIGARPGQAIVPASAVDRPTPGVDALVSAAAPALLERAATGRAERAALTARRASFEASADAAQAARRPQVAALAAVEPARPNARFVPRTDAWNTSWDLGVTVTWQIWDHGRARADRAAALAQASALGYRLADFDAGLGVEVRQRLLDLGSNRAALAASSEAVEAATEARRVVDERFAVGVATSTEVLDAQLALVEAELERTRIQAALRLGEARLLRTVGGR